MSSALRTPLQNGGKKPTIYDIARQTGIGKSTVSRALNGGAVAPETRELVLKAAAELRFRPNKTARSLSRSKTRTIGAYSGAGYLSASNNFMAEIIGGLQRGCDEAEHNLLLHGNFPGLTASDVCDELRAGLIDGLILVLPQPEVVAQLSQGGFPVVVLSDGTPELPSVVIDEARGARLLAEFLASKGHRRILYRKREVVASAQLRLQAFRREARRLQMQLQECSIGPVGVTDEEKALLALPPGERPTVVVGWEDDAACQMCRYLRSAKLRVPEDVAVAGFNGINRPGTGPQLTAVVAPWQEVAARGVQLLLQQLRGEPVPQLTSLPVALEPGETV